MSSVNLNLSKAEEIAVLEKAIAKLGPDSYLGPWLGEIKAQVESQIRSDFFPMITLADCAKDVQDTKDAAKLQAEKIIKDAQLEAAKIRIQSANQIDRAAGILREALRTVEKY